MSQLGFTKGRQIDFRTTAGNIGRGASRMIAALLDSQPGKPVATRQSTPVMQGNVTSQELKKLYRMIGGFDSVNQQVIRQLDLISRRG